MQKNEKTMNHLFIHYEHTSDLHYMVLNLLRTGDGREGPLCGDSGEIEG
jgi:hypothetical protein